MSDHSGHLALFDLDHTLIPFDSGMAWTQFLIARGVLPQESEATYLAFCHEYAAGTLDIHAMHRNNLVPLLSHSRDTLARWQREFEGEVASRLPAGMHELVERHRAAGDLCAIVTATTRLIAEPFARLFCIENLLSTQAATVDGDPHGALTGEIAGEPCYREHKIAHVERWLAGMQRQGGISRFARSWFYSDSMSDLPLLEVVTDPVAVSPDDRLRAHAATRGWPVLGS
ncbi:HAD family hydrolase [soil metagenome]